MFSTHARPAAIRGFLLFCIYFWLNVKLSHQSVKCFRYMYVYLRRKVHVENVTINRICLWFTKNICKMCQLISHVGLWLWVNYEYGLFVYALGSLFLVPHSFFFLVLGVWHFNCQICQREKNSWRSCLVVNCWPTESPSTKYWRHVPTIDVIRRHLCF